MSKFDIPKFHSDMSRIDMFGPAMKITDVDHAVAYFEALVEFHMIEMDFTLERAETHVRSNLGYWAGYHSSEDRERVENLFDCEHPIFGSVKKEGVPTSEEALEMGKQMAERYEAKKKNVE